MATTNNKVQFGLCNVHIAPINDEGGYETPIPVPGAVSITTSPEGNTESFYADNIPYFTAVVNSGYTGDLEMALIPDDVKAKIGLGVIDENGAFVEDADINPKPFALLFDVNGDKHNRHNVLYNVTAARPESEHKTKEDGTTFATDKLSFSAIPNQFEKRNITKLSIPLTDENKTVYDAFFESVLEPKFSPAA